ncbi:YlxM family DNA-binding protein [Tissierella sp.]|uniref:YlxM family DNA-binding protein n=1 Tax=Tissierella sp. TaxID=41274 RepID=UPI0028A75FA5|nr:sigma factor-like helix-turn-helix DNA-binding protein [Tissierella sp.]
MVEKLIEIGILFDFYGKLLSEKQYSVVELYYIHDLSLAEIGDELGVTRQGIFDILRRAEQKLYEYEEKLGLVKKFYSSHEDIRTIIDISEEIVEIGKAKGNDEIKEKAMTINEIGRKVLDNSREVVD